MDGRIGLTSNSTDPDWLQPLVPWEEGKCTQMLASRGQRVYEYRFSSVADSMRKEWPGAPHATEIPFVFDTVRARYGKDLTAADEATAKAALNYWVNFAKTGDPGGEGDARWPAYSAATDELMNFTEAGPKAMADQWKSRLDVTAETVTSMAEGGGR